jgi:hypothetical protein
MHVVDSRWDRIRIGVEAEVENIEEVAAFP